MGRGGWTELGGVLTGGAVGCAATGALAAPPGFWHRQQRPLRPQCQWETQRPRSHPRCSNCCGDKPGPQNTGLERPPGREGREEGVKWLLCYLVEGNYGENGRRGNSCQLLMTLKCHLIIFSFHLDVCEGKHFFSAFLSNMALQTTHRKPFPATPETWGKSPGSEITLEVKSGTKSILWLLNG